MRTNEFFAFLLTFLALVLIFVGAIYTILNLKPRGLDCGYFSVQVEPEFNNLEIEQGRGHLVKVKITNVGVEDEYRLSIKDPNWSLVKPRKMRLAQDGTGEMFVYISPTFDAQGEYDVTLNVKSPCINEDFKIRVNVN